jgi:hypothetical protein
MEREGKKVPMTLEERIAELENTIRGYENDYNTTEDKKEKSELRVLISKRADNLLLLQQQQREERQLLAQQQQPNRGNFNLFYHILLSECDR